MLNNQLGTGIRTARRPRIGLFLVAALLSFGLAPAFAQTGLELSFFPGGGTWPVFAAAAQGYFAREKLDVHMHPVTGSVQQVEGMMDGTYDLGLTALDNVIAYDAGQGDAKLDRTPDLFAFMGGEGGSLRLVAAPSIRDIASLKGKTLAVDAKGTGYAFVLYRIAALHGVGSGQYGLVTAGSTQKRLDALLGGQAQAALLASPADDVAVAKGFNMLADMRQVFPHYQASVGMARRAWAAQHRDALIGFIRAYVAGSRWLFDPKNQAAAIALLIRNTPNLSSAQAASIYRETTGKDSVTSPSAALDPAGVATVVRLRSAYGEPRQKLDARRFYDLAYYRAALR